MNFKRAVGIGVVYYIASFVVGIVAALATGFDFEAGAAFTPILTVIGIVMTLILTPLFTYWYFNSKKGTKITPTLQHGLKLGVVFLLIGTVFDLLTLGAASVAGELPDNPFEFYMDIWFWVMLAVMLASAAGAGHYLANKKAT